MKATDEITFRLNDSEPIRFSAARLHSLCPVEMAAFEELADQIAAYSQDHDYANLARISEEYAKRFMSLQQAVAREARRQLDR